MTKWPYSNRAKEPISFSGIQLAATN